MAVPMSVSMVVLVRLRGAVVGVVVVMAAPKGHLGVMAAAAHRRLLLFVLLVLPALRTQHRAALAVRLAPRTWLGDGVHRSVEAHSGQDAAGGAAARGGGRGVGHGAGARGVHLVVSDLARVLHAAEEVGHAGHALHPAHLGALREGRALADYRLTGHIARVHELSPTSCKYQDEWVMILFDIAQ